MLAAAAAEHFRTKRPNGTHGPADATSEGQQQHGHGGVGRRSDPLQAILAFFQRLWCALFGDSSSASASPADATGEAPAAARCPFARLVGAGGTPPDGVEMPNDAAHAAFTSSQRGCHEGEDDMRRRKPASEIESEEKEAGDNVAAVH